LYRLDDALHDREHDQAADRGIENRKEHPEKETDDRKKNHRARALGGSALRSFVENRPQRERRDRQQRFKKQFAQTRKIGFGLGFHYGPK